MCVCHSSCTFERFPGTCTLRRKAIFVEYMAAIPMRALYSVRVSDAGTLQANIFVKNDFYRACTMQERGAAETRGTQLDAVICAAGTRVLVLGSPLIQLMTAYYSLFNFFSY